ncbi:MAG: GNAT family N-acetyltransferase [Acidimicrobiia bacterium]
MPVHVWRPPLTVRFTFDDSSVELIPLDNRHREVLADAFEDLSERSRYLRFMAPMPGLSPSDLTYLTDLDMTDHFAWGVLVDDRPAAVGRYAKTGPTTAEVAITVLDEFQGRRLGSLLIEVLAVVAAEADISTLEFEVLSENEAMLRILERFGAKLTPDSGVVHAELAIAALPEPPLSSSQLLDTVAMARREGSRGPRSG